MPLSEHEQRLLSQMEQQLLADDPKFASAMKSSERRGGSARRLLVGGLGIVAGLALLVVGVTSDLVVVGVLAFVLMLAGAVYAVSSPRRRTPPQDSRGTRPPGRGPGSGPGRPSGRSGPSGPSGQGGQGGRPQRQGGFMDRVEERWQRRRSDDR